MSKRYSGEEAKEMIDLTVRLVYGNQSLHYNLLNLPDESLKERIAKFMLTELIPEYKKNVPKKLRPEGVDLEKIIEQSLRIIPDLDERERIKEKYGY